MNIEIQKIYAYTLGLISHKDFSQASIEDKIQKKYRDISEEDMLIVMSMLKKEGFINDERYCENFIYWRKERMPRGKRMIIQELIKKKIHISLAQKKCEELIPYEAEYEMCLYLGRIKYNKEKHNIDIFSLKKKVFQYLAGKMFTFQVIVDVWDKLEFENNK